MMHRPARPAGFIREHSAQVFAMPPFGLRSSADLPPLRSAASDAALLPDFASVVAFWREAGPHLWFAKDPEFDRRFRERYLPLHEAAAAGALHGWQGAAEGSLALVLLLDQYPRNAFRGSPRMYATDALARAVADRAIVLGQDLEIAPELRLFVYLPFGHSESVADQDRCAALVAPLGEPTLGRAEHHRGIVRRFGRFPHRNAILGRPSTPDELAFLAGGGYAG
jgi:uncharacterized protein (DUF924 family)